MELNSRYIQAKRATLLGILENVVLTLLKIIFGVLGHSQALIADGVHSFSDLLTDALVLYAAKAGYKKPDVRHPYGHGRIETLATVLLSIILVVVGISIGLDALHSILYAKVLKPGISVVIVAVVSIVVNEVLFRYTLYVSNRIHSNLLQANAWHKRSDALSSIVVLVGISAEMMGWPHFDAIAAIVVAVMIVHMGIKMAWHSAQELIDTGVEQEVLQDIETEILRVPGVESVHEPRTRSIRGEIFVDVHILVDPKLSVSEGHYIGDLVMRMLIQKFPEIADVVVHIDAEDDAKVMYGINLPTRKTLTSLLNQYWSKLPGYSEHLPMNLHYLKSSIEIELILPIHVLQDVGEAQKIVADYQSVMQSLEYISRVDVCFS